MNQESGNTFITWVLANLLGCVALALLLFVIPSIMSIRNLVATAIIISLPISFAQWLALRRISRTSVLWILTIPVGLILAALILRSIPDLGLQGMDDESIVTLTAENFLIGLLIGLLQWFILRQQFSNALLWLLGSALGMGGGFALVMATDLIDQAGVLAIIVAVLVYVLVTGWFLSRLLAHPNQSKLDAINAA